MFKKIFIYLLLTIFLSPILAQSKLRVFGYVIDNNNRGIELANVYFDKTTIGTTTNQNGYYELSTSVKDSVMIVFSMLGYETIRHTLYPKQAVMQISVELRPTSTQIQDLDVIAQRRQTSTMDYLDPLKSKLMPNISGNFESILITFAGVTSNNELSSQYNVRGGNFDENIVYVNGIEVYRPLLVRAGQQEGLSFINNDMVQKVGFSSGAFNAEYGDKMSSVLDIEYKKPAEFESSVSMSLLGATAYVGTSKNKFTQLHGIRYKTSAYLLGSLDTQGEYNPSFIDYQGYFTYKLSEKSEMTFLGNFSQNIFNFVPTTRETNFGTYNMGRKLTIFFEGQEKDIFRTAFGALSYHYHPQQNIKLSLTSSAFQTDENENFDILSEYHLGEVKMDLKEENREGATLGIGKYHEHARNILNATVVNIGHTGEFNGISHKLKWGANLQREIIADQISEWEWRDSVGYSLPYDDESVNLYYNMKAANTLTSWRTTAFLQDTYKWRGDAGSFTLTGGVRAHYWTFNKELLVSPRVSLAFIPAWEKDFSFRLGTGLYYQAPFYKEIRDTVSDALGNVNIALNEDIRAQRSVQLVLGGDHYFRAFGRPFKFTTEAYLKLADRVITYDVDNVQITYSGYNNAKAYTAGIDFKLFGELVPGTDSWINFSLMNSKEDIIGDSYLQHTYDENRNITSSAMVWPSWISRPNEQRYAFSMMFQDYLPNNPNYKLQLKFIYSDGMPYGPPRNNLYRGVLRAPAYKRVDIGASRILVSGKDALMNKKWMKGLQSIWLNLEVFNLMDFKNVNSYYWVTDIYGQQLAVPNYLTGRQFNVKLIVDFK
ncbi:MAG: carboxypeptidase-like regulatory domain-containing protein [Paludibacter sp.]|nr:carboxypeptidase-like regulatory domain-containing protein [Paludibacter sp.]